VRLVELEAPRDQEKLEVAERKVTIGTEKVEC
jgi:hypothetical protein